MAQAIRRNNIAAIQRRRITIPMVRRAVLNIACGLLVCAALVSMFYVLPAFDGSNATNAQVKAGK